MMNWTTRFIGALFLILMFQHPAKAQLKENGNIELPIENEQYHYMPFSLESEGILLYRELRIKSSNVFELIRVDTSLKVVWRGGINLKENSKYQSAKIFNHHIWMLFRNEKGPYDYQLYDIDITDGRYKMININEKDSFTPSSFLLRRDFILIAGTQSKRSVFLYHSLRDHRSHFLSGFTDTKNEINQVSLDSDGNIEIILTARSRKQNALSLLKFDSAGSFISEVVIQSEKHNFSSAKLIHASSKKRILFGTHYRLKDKSKGVFSAVLDSANQTKLKYYYFEQLRHFTEGSGDINSASKASKNLKQNFYLQQPYNQQGQVVVVANSFIPVFNKPVPQYRSSIAAARLDSVLLQDVYGPLSAYKLGRAVILHFDGDGKLVADDSFSLLTTSSQLENAITFFVDSDKNSFFFLKDNSVVSKVQTDGQLVSNAPWRPTTSFSSTINNRKIRLRELHPWYKDYMLCTGVISGSTNDTYIPKPTFQFSLWKLKVE